MKIIAVNVSLPKEVEYRGEKILTGIFKEPVPGRVWAGKLNLAGDGQADLDNHGGSHKAVSGYPFAHYDYWRKELGRREDIPHGGFGENLTLEGLTEEEAHIGDVFRVGGALLEVTQPRVPCSKLALKMDLAGFPKLFLASGRTGFYLRVLEEGEIGAGDEMELVSAHPEKMTVREIHQLVFFDKLNREAAEKALSIQPLSTGWQEAIREILGLPFQKKSL